MSLNDLCWRCKEELKNIEGYDLGLIVKRLHCHHEPKEELECACKRYKIDTISAWVYYIKEPSSSITQIALTNNFCPECGRKLDE